MSDELRIFLVEAAAGPLLANMTFPAYRHLMSMQAQPRHRDEADQRPVQPLALAALLGEKPIALALVELPLQQGFGPELLSLFVQAEHRGQGVATKLLAAVEEQVAAQGYARMLTTWMSGKASIPIFERVLEKRQWSPPAMRMVTVKFNVEDLDKAEWIHKYKPRREYQIFSWMDVGEDEREQLKRSQQAAAWIPEDLLPWQHDGHGFEPVTSVGVRYRGEIVGWVINHKLGDDTVRYTCSFIRDDLARMGRILPLYRESFARLRRFGFKRGMFVTPLHHAPMAAFARRWFGPWAYFCGETRGSEKLLPRADNQVAHGG